MGSFRVSWLLIVTLSFLFNNNFSAEANHHKKLPSAVVVGTVYCDTCFQQDFSSSSHFISGATVAVKCGDGGKKTGFYKETRTNEHGVFKVHLPVSVSKHVKKIKECSVRLISSSEPFCAVASSATSSSLHLKSWKEGTHIFSAGFFTFKPLKQPDVCNQKPSQKFGSMKDIPMIPTLPNLPTIPLLPTLPPLPQLPPMPNLPPLPSFGRQPSLPFQPLPTVPVPNLPPLGRQPSLPVQPLPTVPVPNLPPLGQPPSLPIQPQSAKEIEKGSPVSGQGKAKPAFIFPPLFPTPPPAIVVPLPPNPLQPPALLPPVPGLTPPAPAFNLPPIFPPVIPGLTPPSPPLPTFPFPFPRLPFPPGPGFPGIPPASGSKGSSP